MENIISRHCCILTAPFPSAVEAKIAFNSLRVDPEPRKSLVFKQLSVDENQLIANFKATEARLLRVAVGSYLDHLILVVDTIKRFKQSPAANHLQEP